jgi:signal transduction histidine kinase
VGLRFFPGLLDTIKIKTEGGSGVKANRHDHQPAASAAVETQQRSTVIRPWRSLRWRLLLGMVAAIVGVMVPLVFAVYFVRDKGVRDFIAAKAQTLAELTAPAVGRALWNLDDTEVRLIMEGVSHDPDFLYAHLKTEFVKDFEVGVLPAPNEEAITITHRVEFASGDTVQWMGDLTLTLSISRAIKRVDELIALTLLAGIGVAVAVVAIVYALLARMVFRPLRLLIRAIDAVRRGEWRPWHWRHDDEFARVVDAFNDMVTAVQAQEQRLRVARDDAESASGAKSSFMARMSHEMRTPLNVIIGFADLIGQDDRASPEQRDYAREIAQSGHRLLNMVIDVLDLAELESGVVEPREAEADIQRLARTALAALDLRRPGVEAMVSIEIAPDLPRLRCDTARIRRLLEHLLDNAAKFGLSNSAIALRAWLNDAGALVLEVENAARETGLTDAVLRQAVRPFVGHGELRTRAQEGAGLGLSLCWHYAELHGASLSLNNDAGVTRCQVTFPTDRLSDRFGKATINAAATRQ